jgi:ABC-type branched-subunit amino acid transport system ATPase component
VSTHNEPLLAFDHVKKHFGGLFVTNDVSFSVQQGEVLFIIGPNGAGKTTIFNLITGFVRQTRATSGSRASPSKG